MQSEKAPHKRGFFIAVWKGLLLLLGNGLLESLARAELGNLGSGNLDLFAGLGIPARTGLPLGYLEGAEADEGNAITLFQGIAYGTDEGANGLLGSSLGQLGGFCDGFHEFSFGHNEPSSLCLS
jgi:hypothetical protein